MKKSLSLISSIDRHLVSNIYWTGLNVFTRYILSFLATTYIARQYSVSEFNLYQISLVYLGLFESINILNPSYTRTLLAEGKITDGELRSTWKRVYLILAILISIFYFLKWFINNFNIQDGLIFCVSLRLYARTEESIFSILDNRKMEKISQKINILGNLAFNITRLTGSFFRVSILGMTILTTLQGFFQLFLQKREFFKIEIFEIRQKTKTIIRIIRTNINLIIMGILFGFQVRIYGIIFPNFMPLAISTNFLLVMRLIEPITNLGISILGVNFSRLAIILENESEKNFKKEFIKLSLTVTLITVFICISMQFFNLNFLKFIFANKYNEGINSIRFTGFIAIPFLFFNISNTLDILKKNYFAANLKILLNIITIYICAKLNSPILTADNGIMILGCAILLGLIISELLVFFIKALKKNLL